MAMNYDKLWKLLIDKKMNRTDLHEQAHVSTNAIATMGKGGDVSTKVLDKLGITLIPSKEINLTPLLLKK